MVENKQSLTVRPKLLPNNSAAEFVETRTEDFLGSDFCCSHGTEFAPEVDMFVDRDVVPSLQFDNYSQASQDKRKEFEALLVRYSEQISDREQANRFRLKTLPEYKIQDVLEIAERVQSKHRSVPQVRDCTDVFRRCFAAVGRNHGIVRNFLGFIPNDSYGSIIFGGFTVILTAIERAETVQETAYAALAEIPRRLELVHNLSDCVRETIELYRAMDAVLVALFGALTKIIDHLENSKKSLRRALSLVVKGKSYGSDLDSSLEFLETKLSAFKDEVDLCNSQRFGDIDRRVELMEQSQHRMEKSQHRYGTVILDYINQVTAEKAAIEARQADAATSIEQDNANKRIIEEKGTMIDVLNSFYTTCASHPRLLISAQDIHQDDARQLKANKLLNESIGNTWLSALPLQFHEVSTQAMQRLLEDATSMETMDQYKVQFIMADAKLFEWLNAQESVVLLIQDEVAPDDLINSLSFSSAFLAKTLSGTYKSPVLYYNCRYRVEESHDELMSGPLALLSTLNAELITHILDTCGESVQLDFLERNRLSKALRKRLKQSRHLFKRLVESLPESDVVFIIIEGMSYLMGAHDEKMVSKVLHDLLRLATRSTTPRIKLLMTDVLSRTVLDEYDYLEVIVPSRVDSSGQSLNLEWLREETTLPASS